MRAWRIRNWDEHFEVSQLRKVKKSLSWVAVPTKHDGRSFRRIARHPDAIAVYCAWQLMVQVAAKMPVRGILADGDGPLDSDDLSDKTGFPAQIFDKAFSVLTDKKINWLDSVDVPDAGSALVAPATILARGVLHDRQDGQDKTVQDATTAPRKGGLPLPSERFPAIASKRVDEQWTRYVEVRMSKKNGGLHLHSAEALLFSLSKLGSEDKAFRALVAATAGDWHTFHDPDHSNAPKTPQQLASERRNAGGIKIGDLAR